MIRVFISFSLLVLIVFSSIGGCGNGGNDNGMEPEQSPEPTDIPSPEPTPQPTLEPTPEPGDGFGCDSLPDENDFFYTEGDCTYIANVFNCVDYSYQGITCEVSGCEDCLCNATSQIIEDTSDFGCALAAALGNCAKAIFNDEIGTCRLLVCVTEAPCGPIDEIIP